MCYHQAQSSSDASLTLIGHGRNWQAGVDPHGSANISQEGLDSTTRAGFLRKISRRKDTDFGFLCLQLSLGFNSRHMSQSFPSGKLSALGPLWRAGEKSGV